MQNILNIWNLDIKFYYILIGLEDSANDNYILKNKLFDYNFIILDKKYYLVNISYYNTNY